MYLTKGLSQNVWEVKNAPEAEKRRIVRSMEFPQIVSSFGGLGQDKTFQERISDITTGLDRLKSFIGTKTQITLPPEVKEKISGAVKAVKTNWVPIAIGVVVVGAGAYFFLTQKKKPKGA